MDILKGKCQGDTLSIACDVMQNTVENLVVS